MEDAVRCVDNYSYKLIYYASLAFGTCNMTIVSKTHQIVSYASSLSWCLAIVGNQIDYAMKPRTDGREDETAREDTAFEKIVRLDFWTYNAICLLSCALPSIGRKAELNVLNDLQTSRNWTRDARRTAVVVCFVAANAAPAIFSSGGVQEMNAAAYNNSLFLDVCKLGALTADLQFVRYCWSLGDGFTELNARLSRVARPVASDGIRRADAAYRTLAEGARAVNGVCGARVLANVSCYTFAAMCGLFDTISAYRKPAGARPVATVAVRLWRAANCAASVTLVCVAASAVADQDERVHDTAQTARETLGDDCTEMKRFLRRLTYCKVKFNVCGMITIDKTLLYSAVTSAVSYLVIVLQYNYN